MRLHLRGKSHRHAPAKMGAGSSPCANTLNESGKAHARGAWIKMDWNTCGVGELVLSSVPVNIPELNRTVTNLIPILGTITSQSDHSVTLAMTDTSSDNYASQAESPTTNDETHTKGLTVPLVITVSVLLVLLLLAIFIILFIIVFHRSKRKPYQNNLEMKDIKQSQEVESDHQHNGDHQHHDTLDVNNPMYSNHNRTTTQPSSSAATGVYSEVTVDMVYREVKKDTLTETVYSY